MSSVSGDAGNTKWKMLREGLGQKNENSTRTMQLREYARRNSGKSSWMKGHSAATRVSSMPRLFNMKPYSPYAVAIMDAIYGWEDEEKRVGSKFAACMWTYTEEVLTRGQILNSEKEEYLKK